MAKIAVIILTFNQRDRTIECIKSLLASQEAPFQILVWDNGSEDGTEEAVQEAFPEVVVHYHPTNLGVASGRNAAAQLAIEMVEPTHLVFLDNDMLVEPSFISSLLQPFENDKKVGQTQAKLRFMDDPSRLNDAGGAQINFITWQITPVGYEELDQGQYDQVRPCISCGGAMMVRADVFQEIGAFDPIFNPFGPEDLDFSLRLQEAGYKALYVPQALAYHTVSHTFGEGYTEEYARHKSRHWFAFMRRHASPVEKIGFFLVGLPYLTIRVFFREVRRGNLQAVRGLVRGVYEYSKSAITQQLGTGPS